MWQRFTERARKVIFYAQEESQRCKHQYVATEHLLLGMLRDRENLACRIIEAVGVKPEELREAVEESLSRSAGPATTDMTLTPRAKRVIDLSYDEARSLNNNYIGTEHLLLGLIREGDGLAGRVLDRMGVDLEKARRETMKLQDEGATSPPPETEPQVAMYVPKGGDHDFLPFLSGRCLNEHLLLSFIADEGSKVNKIIGAQCTHPKEIQNKLWNIIVDASRKGFASGSPDSLDDLLVAAQTEAEGSQLESHHLLLALLRQADTPLSECLRAEGLTLEKTRDLAGKEL